MLLHFTPHVWCCHADLARDVVTLVYLARTSTIIQARLLYREYKNGMKTGFTLICFLIIDWLIQFRCDRLKDSTYLGIILTSGFPSDHAKPISGNCTRSSGWDQKIHSLKQTKKENKFNLISNDERKRICLKANSDMLHLLSEKEMLASIKNNNSANVIKNRYNKPSS